MSVNAVVKFNIIKIENANGLIEQGYFTPYKVWYGFSMQKHSPE